MSLAGRTESRPDRSADDPRAATDADDAGARVEFRRVDPCASFDREWRGGGAFGPAMSGVDPGPVDVVDPVVDEIAIIASTDTVTGEPDRGDGRCSCTAMPRTVGLQPAVRTCME